MKCKDVTLQTINLEECLSPSLRKINYNFSSLNDLVCELRKRTDTNKQIRTFFYYGPNSQLQASYGMDTGQLSRPSNLTIEAFVNSPNQLNLSPISQFGDIAYVIYQKTGFQGALPIEKNTTQREFDAATSQVIEPGSQTVLQFNKWYNVSDYYTAEASSDGFVGTKTTYEPQQNFAGKWGRFNLQTKETLQVDSRLGTITLKFKTPSGQTKSYTYTANANASIVDAGRGFRSIWSKGRLSYSGGDDTYLSWSRTNVTWAEGGGTVGQKSFRGSDSFPFANVPGTQFLFEIKGNPISSTISAFRVVTQNQTQLGARITLEDKVTEFAPVFIIWKLIFNGNEYETELGFPKFNKGFAYGFASTDWDNPATWGRYSTYI